MLRKIITIDEERCNGCGLCVPNCVEGALQIVDGKARLVSEVYCDGLGACLGHCPQDAITIEEREAPQFDEKAVDEFLVKSGKAPLSGHGAHAPAAPQSASQQAAGPAKAGGCPSAAVRSFGCPGSAARSFAGDAGAGQGTGAGSPAPAADDAAPATSALTHWPVQLRLVPPFAPFLKGAHILVTADCVPFALPDLHARYLQGRVVLVGCPKFDDVVYYQEKLAHIITEAQPASLTVLRMEVPCCGGIAGALTGARDAAAPEMPVTIVTVGVQGSVREEISGGAAPAVSASAGR